MKSLDKILLAASRSTISRIAPKLFKMIDEEEYVAQLSDGCWINLSDGKIMTASHRWQFEEVEPSTRTLLSIMTGKSSQILRRKWTHFRDLRELFTEHVRYYGGADLSSPKFVEVTLRYHKIPETVTTLYSTFDDTKLELERFAKELR